MRQTNGFGSFPLVFVTSASARIFGKEPGISAGGVKQVLVNSPAKLANLFARSLARCSSGIPTKFWLTRFHRTPRQKAGPWFRRYLDQAGSDTTVSSPLNGQPLNSMCGF